MSDMMTQEEAMNMSNEQAVQILIPMRNMMCDQNGCPISDAVFALDKAIEVLSADRPRGEWVRHEHPRYEYDRENGDTEAGIWYSCSICQSIPVYKSNFCPNCGADMRERESE